MVDYFINLTLFYKIQDQQLGLHPDRYAASAISLFAVNQGRIVNGPISWTMA